MYTDAELLRRWGEGDTAAGEALFERYFDAIHRYFTSKLAGESEDLVQRTFTACLEKRGTIREATSFRAFLFGIARFELLMELRHRHGGGAHGVDLSVSIAPELDQQLARQRAHQQVAEALRRMPAGYKQVLELHYWEDKTTAEIAHEIGVAQGTVKSRLRLARERLAKTLDSM